VLILAEDSKPWRHVNRLCSFVVRTVPLAGRWQTVTGHRATGIAYFLAFFMLQRSAQAGVGLTGRSKCWLVCSKTNARDGNTRHRDESARIQFIQAGYKKGSCCCMGLGTGKIIGRSVRF